MCNTQYILFYNIGGVLQALAAGQRGLPELGRSTLRGQDDAENVGRLQLERRRHLRRVLARRPSGERLV